MDFVINRNKCITGLGNSLYGNYYVTLIEWRLKLRHIYCVCIIISMSILFENKYCLTNLSSYNMPTGEGARH